ncbi:hypothetical protein EJB05_56566, partial [Eragrostis curvula]
MPPKVALLEREWNDTFGHSECTDAYLDDNFTSNFGPRASARSPGSSLVPRPSAGKAVVFLEFFKHVNPKALNPVCLPSLSPIESTFNLHQSEDSEIVSSMEPPKWLVQVDVDHDDDFEGCIDSLRKIRPLLSCRDLVEEYISAGVDPLRPSWDLQFAEGLYANGLLKYVLTSDALSIPEVEELAMAIVGPYIDKKEAGRQEAGIPARLTRSFAARDQPYEDYGAPIPKRKRSSKVTASEEPEPSRKRHRKNAPGPARRHLRKAALNVKLISVAPPRDSAGDEGSPGDHSGEDCSSKEDPFGELPRFCISEDDDPIEFSLDSDYEGHGLPSLTPSEVFLSAAVMGDVEKVLPDILFAKERKQLSGVHYGHLFQALYANQAKVFPVFGAIEDQFFYFRNRLRHYRQRFRDTRSELREKDSEERKVSSSLFKACKDLRDCLLYLGVHSRELWSLGWSCRYRGSLRSAELVWRSMDPILDEGFSPAEELPDPIPDEARSSFFKMASHWQDVGSGRVSSFVDKFRGNQNSAASDDAADDVPE